MEKVKQKTMNNLMRNLLKYYDPSVPVHTQRPECRQLLHEIRADPGMMDALDILAARGYLSYETTAGNDALISISILPRGVTYFADQQDQQAIQARETRRYWITTLIALIALIRAFMPELRAAAALLWTLLGLGAPAT